MSERTSLAEKVQKAFPQRVIATHHYRGNETVIIKREGLLEVCRFLRDDPQMAFNFLMDLTCVDYLMFGQALESEPTMRTPSPLPYFMKPKPIAETWERLPASPKENQTGAAQAGLVDEGYRFEVVYHFYSLTANLRLRVKVPLTEHDPQVDSLTSLWQAANWFEREVWDMFGIHFNGHPNLKRILMYEPFEGHPLRKDYPVNRRQPLIGPAN